MINLRQKSHPPAVQRTSSPLFLRSAPSLSSALFVITNTISACLIRSAACSMGATTAIPITYAASPQTAHSIGLPPTVEKICAPRFERRLMVLFPPHWSTQAWEPQRRKKLPPMWLSKNNHSAAAAGGVHLSLSRVVKNCDLRQQAN